MNCARDFCGMPYWLRPRRYRGGWAEHARAGDVEVRDGRAAAAARVLPQTTFACA